MISTKFVGASLDFLIQITSDKIYNKPEAYFPAVAVDEAWGGTVAGRVEGCCAGTLELVD